MHFQQIVARRRHILAQPIELIGAGHQAVEHLLGDRDEVRVRHPGTIVAVAGFALLVGADAGEGGVVGGGVVLDRDLRRHTAHSKGAAAMAGLDQLLRIGAQEGVAHPHLRAVWGNERRMLAQGLDKAENIIPAAAIQARHVVAQLVEDFIHLERRRQGFDQRRHLDRTSRNVEVTLGEDDGLIPQPGFEVRLHLGQIEIGTAAGGDGGLGTVEHVKPEVEQGARHGGAVDDEVALVQPPAARSHDQHSGGVAETIGLAGLGVVIGEGARPTVLQIGLAVDAVGKGRRIGVLEIGHKHLGARVQSIDDHLAIDRTGDLDTAVVEVGGYGRHAPVTVADGFGFRQEIGQGAGIETPLTLAAGGEAFLALELEAAVQFA